MNPRQEHDDYMMGEASELQNALALSRLEEPPDDMGKINELVAKGRFVVGAWGITYCPRTDAVLGRRTVYVSDHSTREEAIQAALKEMERLGDCDGETGVNVYPLEPQQLPRTTLTEADIPF
jgi:hypothetical protein